MKTFIIVIFFGKYYTNDLLIPEHVKIYFNDVFNYMINFTVKTQSLRNCCAIYLKYSRTLRLHKINLLLIEYGVCVVYVSLFSRALMENFDVEVSWSNTVKLCSRNFDEYTSCSTVIKQDVS